MLANSQLNEDVLQLIFNELLHLPKDSDRIRSIYRVLTPPTSQHFALSSASIRDLSSASLVCKDWSRVAQEKLFYILTIICPADEPQVSQVLCDWAQFKVGGLPSRVMLLEVDIVPGEPLEDVDWTRKMAGKCSRLHTLLLTFDIVTPTAFHTAVQLPAPGSPSLTALCLSFRNLHPYRPKLDPWNPELVSRTPSISVEWDEFRHALMAMPSLKKLVIILPVDVGFTHAKYSSSQDASAFRPTFQLEYLELYAWEFIPSSQQHKWLLSASHSTLQVAIVHLEGVDALLDCHHSLKRLRVIDFDRWHEGRLMIPDSTMKILPDLLGRCGSLTEVTAHVEVLEALLQGPSLPVSASVERIMMGALDYDTGEDTWREKYPRLLRELVDGPLSMKVLNEEASRKQWKRLLPNLKVAILEALSDCTLDDDDEEEDSLLNKLKEAAEISGVRFWREVYVDNWVHPPPVDTLGLE